MFHKEKGMANFWRSATKMKIDQTNDYWYKVRTASGLEGWTYGAYIDFSEGANQ